MRYCKKCLQTDTRPGIKFLENDICPDCGAGELLYSVEEIGFDPRVINKYPLNNEYIDILHLIKPNNLEILFGIQTIYAKYHPKANEHYVIEEKLKKSDNTMKNNVNSIIMRILKNDIRSVFAG